MEMHCYVYITLISCIRNKKVYTYVYKKVNLINHDCLRILMLLCIMLHIMLAYLMLFAALSNAVCLYNAFFAIDFCKCFLFSCFVLVY